MEVTVDASEILFPTTWDGAETLKIMGKTTNLNWWFQPSTVITSKLGKLFHLFRGRFYNLPV